jgi:pimeloyl-ACP methyl ester carboxylesterase
MAEGQIEAMPDPTTRLVKGDGVQLNLAVWEGRETPVVCIHGLTANCRCWDVIAASLAPRHRVVAMDLRGRGRSDKPETGYGLDRHIRDLYCLFENIDIDRGVIMGHSLGAMIGLAFAANYPDRVEQLILVDGGGDLSAEQQDKVLAGIKPALDRLGAVFPSAEEYLQKMRQSPYLQPWSPAVETHYRYELEAVEGGMRVNIHPDHIRQEIAEMRETTCGKFFSGIRCPVLILRAVNGLLSREDLLLPEEVVGRMLREIPGARRFDVQGVNHYGIVFQPHEARDRAILKFTGKNTASGKA